MEKLISIAKEVNNYHVIDALKKYRQTYGYMLHYFINGANDPSRNEVFMQTKIGVLELCDELIYDMEMSESSDVYYSTARICRHGKLDFSNIWSSLEDILFKESLNKETGYSDSTAAYEKDSILRQLFDFLWTSRFNNELGSKVSNKILESNITENISCYAVSALVISLLVAYDRYKFVSLLDIYDNTESESIAATALVGIVLVCERYSDRIETDKNIIARMSLWQDSLITYSRLKTVIKEIIRTRDTDRVTAKMRDEVIPGLMKLRPDMLNRMRNSITDFETGMLENNPEWEEMLEKNGIADKMRELTEMQSEGADILMVTFSNLKNFPFFQNVNSWFLPFDTSNPAISLPQDSVNQLNKIMSIGANMCDSDKYSLVFALGTMPKPQRDMMFGQFEQQMNQITEENLEKLSNTSNTDFTRYSVIFIRELYRFFKLYRRKGEFTDPFIQPLDFLSMPVIGNIIAGDEIISVVGEFYFKRGYYKEALELFSVMEQSFASDHTYWEKVGYAFQCMKQYENALDAYTKSSLLSDPGQWLLMRLAHVNKRLGNFNDAAAYYVKALKNDSDNISLLMNAGNTILETGDIQGALKHYYHADYIDSENIKIKRAIAWAELMSWNFTKSAQVYDKIFSGKITIPDAVDYLNYGHVLLAMGKMNEAVDMYRKSDTLDSMNFEEAFNADRKVLTKLGIDDTTQSLLLEAVCYKDS